MCTLHSSVNLLLKHKIWNCKILSYKTIFLGNYVQKSVINNKMDCYLSDMQTLTWRKNHNISWAMKKTWNIFNTEDFYMQKLPLSSKSWRPSGYMNWVEAVQNKSFILDNYTLLTEASSILRIWKASPWSPFNDLLSKKQAVSCLNNFSRCDCKQLFLSSKLGFSDKTNALTASATSSRCESSRRYPTVDFSGCSYANRAEQSYTGTEKT